jgi:hypothetical protein
MRRDASRTGNVTGLGESTFNVIDRAAVVFDGPCRTLITRRADEYFGIGAEVRRLCVTRVSSPIRYRLAAFERPEGYEIALHHWARKIFSERPRFSWDDITDTYG